MIVFIIFNYFRRNDDDEDSTDYTQIKRDPFKPIGDKVRLL